MSHRYIKKDCTSGKVKRTSDNKYFKCHFLVQQILGYTQKVKHVSNETLVIEIGRIVVILSQTYCKHINDKDSL